MRTLLAIAVIAATSVTAHATAIYTIGSPIVNPANQHTYHLLSASSWTDAEAYAQTLGGHLATINDAAENAWVYNTFSTYEGMNRTLWIGLNDVAAEGNFVWSSGDLAAYTNWSPGEPNNYNNEDYGYIFNPLDTRAGSWNDNDNFGTVAGTVSTIPVNGVVEVVPEPSSLALTGLGALGFILSRKFRSSSRVA